MLDYVVCVEFTLKPEHASDFLALIIKNARTSVDKEQGCKQFDVCIAPDDSTKIFLYEVYTSKEAFDLHLKSEHFLLFNSQAADMIADKEVHTYIRNN